MAGIGERWTKAGDRPPASLGLLKSCTIHEYQKCRNLLEQSKHRQQTRGRLKRTPHSTVHMHSLYISATKS